MNKDNNVEVKDNGDILISSIYLDKNNGIVYGKTELLNLIPPTILEKVEPLLQEAIDKYHQAIKIIGESLMNDDNSKDIKDNINTNDIDEVEGE